MKCLNPKLLGAVFLAITFTFTSCSKYDDGPEFSLRTKKSRVTNTWEVEKAMEDGNDVTSSYDQYELEIRKDNSTTLTAIYESGDATLSFETDGTWEFQNNKADLDLDYEDDGADRTYIILRLTNEELWLLHKGDDVELHLRAN